MIPVSWWIAGGLAIAALGTATGYLAGKDHQRAADDARVLRDQQARADTSLRDERLMAQQAATIGRSPPPRSRGRTAPPSRSSWGCTMTFARHLLLWMCAALCLTGCATGPRLSTEQRSERPMLPTPPASLLGGERSQPPLDNSGAAYVEAYGAAQLAIERASRKLAGWAALWACAVEAMTTGKPTTACGRR